MYEHDKETFRSIAVGGLLIIGYIPNIRTKKQNNVRILIDPVFVVG